MVKSEKVAKEQFKCKRLKYSENTNSDITNLLLSTTNFVQFFVDYKDK